MDIRKIAVVGGFALGAALAFAPLASADTLTDTVDSEIASLNSLFTLDATLGGVPTGDITTAADGFELIKLADVSTVESTYPTFDSLVFGLNPDSLTGDPGAYDVLNGALVNFDDAYNVELFSLLNPDAAIGTIPLDDLFGTSANIAEALGTGTAAGAIGDFLTNGFSDLLGYL